jgi:hypothetical protein
MQLKKQKHFQEPEGDRDCVSPEHLIPKSPAARHDYFRDAGSPKDSRQQMVARKSPSSI